MLNFRSFDKAVQFYHLAQTLAIKSHLKEQLLRAAASIALNLAEGRGKATVKDQVRFFYIAFGSVRECQAILTLANLKGSEEWKRLDIVAAHIYKLIQKAD